MLETPSCLAISRKLSGLLLYFSVDVREITLRSAILESRVKISSWIPSAKYALDFSSLRFSNGRTAMDFSFANGAGAPKKKKQAAATAARNAATRVTNTRRLGRLISLALESPPDLVCDNDPSASSFAL